VHLVDHVVVVDDALREVVVVLDECLDGSAGGLVDQRAQAQDIIPDGQQVLVKRASDIRPNILPRSLAVHL
jgi:hypothetical protein